MKAIKKISFLTAIFALFLGFSFSASYAQVGEDTEGGITTQPEAFTLQAEVVDWETEDALADAQVIVVGNTDLNTMTNAQGEFTLESVPAGTHTIKVKLDDYQTWEKEVAVNADKELTIKLKPAIQ